MSENDARERIQLAAMGKKEHLDLARLRLKTVPEEAFKLTRLKTLDLSENLLEDLPTAIRDLGGLRQLYLQGNKFRTIRSDICELFELRALHLHDNCVESLPAEIGKLASLTALSLYNNKLRALPSEIGELRNLAVLTVYKNEISQLPSTIGRLGRLTSLNVAGNALESIPPEIGNLRALRNAYFAKNRLTILPTEFERLQSLEGLYLDDNQLEALHQGLLRLNGLTELTLHGNPRLEIPDSILGPTYEEIHKHRRTPSRPYDILNFYFDRLAGTLKGDTCPLKAVKVMLVGEGGAGKTSLRRFFLGQPHSPREPETLGIARDQFELGQNDNSYDVSLWDFAGQEITHALHQFFLTEGCIYLVVVEPRSDNEQSDLEKWLKQIKRYGGGSPVIVVLNKQDTRLPAGYDVDQHLLRERFPFIHSFVSTSCGEVRQGCDFLLEQLYSLVLKMPDANMFVRKSWINVMHSLRFDHIDGVSSRKIMDFPDFRRLCSAQGETDLTKQESLARILHKLGTVVHFIDEPKLRDTTILDPHWVTDGTYRLLRYKDGPYSNGVLSLREAMAAVPGVDKQGAMYLLNLMERFEMCFRIEDDASNGDDMQWLIPGALPKNQPESVHARDWEGIDRIRIRYVYDPLPQSVIPRLIVLTQSLNQGEVCWRNGMILQYGLSKALVRKGVTDNAIEVTSMIIDKPNDGQLANEEASRDRKMLMKYIRGYLDRIHQDLPQPGPHELQELSGLPGEYWEIRQLEANEQKRVSIVVRTPEGDAEERDATEELNRVSDPGPRKGNKRPLRVFLSYAHEDRRKQQQFRKNLVALENDGYITFWDDPNITPGMEWRAEIEKELEAMDVFIGLLTTNFRTSNFINRVEFERATQRPELQKRLWLIQVDRNTRIAGSVYERFQIIRPNNKAVHQGRSLRDGFDAVEREIQQQIVLLWNEQNEGP